MQIVKVYNNNVVQVVNNQEELIVMGRGIGFQKKVGDFVNQDGIEKTFVLKEEVNATMPMIYQNMTSEEIDVVIAIIHYSEKKLQTSFQSNLYITLADHIHFAMERAQEGLTLTSPLAYEVRKFYPAEYEVAKQAVRMLEEQLAIHLGEDEATSLALYFVNAQKEGSLLERTVQITQLAQNLLDIVRLHFQVELDEDSIAYNRFVTHLQYFAQRVVTGMVQGTNDSFLYEQIEANYPNAFRCTEKIKQYVESRYSFAVGRDEQVYLAIHVQKLIYPKG